jgi:hypothetical protein
MSPRLQSPITTFGDRLFTKGEKDKLIFLSPLAEEGRVRLKKQSAIKI